MEYALPWDEHPRDACGVVGIFSEGNIIPEVIAAMTVIQHRGQESAGIAYPDKTERDRLRRRIGMGLVHDVFKNFRHEHVSDVCIGHVRYSTTGRSRLENSQPFVVGMADWDIAIAHNGDIVNADKLRNDILTSGSILVTDTDSEIMIRLLAGSLSKGMDVKDAITSLCEKLVGSYSCVFLLGSRMFAFRDPYGFRPLCVGQLPYGGHMVASESVAIDVLGGKLIRDVEPGEIVEITKDGVVSMTNFRTNKNTGKCMFEWVYFARPDSVIDGISVYEVRRQIGETLAKEHPVDADVDIR